MPLAKYHGSLTVSIDFGLGRGIGAIEKKDIARTIQGFCRAKGECAVEAFGRSRDPRSLCSIKG